MAEIKKDVTVTVSQKEFTSKETGKTYPYLEYSLVLENGFVARLVPMDKAHKTMLNFEFLGKI